MPKFVLFLCLMFVVKLAVAQPLKGTYLSQLGGSLEFVGDSVRYSVNFDSSWQEYLPNHTYAGSAIPIDNPLYAIHYLTLKLNGIGTWFVKDNLLFFKPIQIAVLDTGFKAIPASDADKIKFKVTTVGKDGTSKPVVGASVAIVRNKRIVAGAATDLDGVAMLPRSKLKPADTVLAGYSGYHMVKFLVSKLYDYEINLVLGWDKHPEYATNGSEHFPMRLYPDSVQLQLPVGEKGRLVRKWVTFVKQ